MYPTISNRKELYKFALLCNEWRQKFWNKIPFVKMARNVNKKLWYEWIDVETIAWFHSEEALISLSGISDLDSR